MASSSTQKPHHFFSTYAAAAASAATPPSTPSTHEGNHHLPTSDTATAETLSHLFHRLQPTLSLPSRFSARAATVATTSPPTISFSEQNSVLLSSVASRHGFFQLTHHPVAPQLAQSAESDSLALFSLPQDQKRRHFPQSWPLGYHKNDEDEEGVAPNESFCFDVENTNLSSTESTEVSLSHLSEFARELEKVGLELVELLSCAVGFVNPLKDGPTRLCSLMWIEGSVSDQPGQPNGRLYPYVIGLRYQIRSQKYCLIGDSGSVQVLPDVDSLFVTLGDIAQVWSNGKIKKVRGTKPMNNTTAADTEGSEKASSGSCISLSVLLTLPLESTVSPLLPLPLPTVDDDNEDDPAFDPFSFEDYAWRVYHERLLLKDPLERHRRT